MPSGASSSPAAILRPRKCTPTRSTSISLPTPSFARKLANDGLAAYPANARLASAKGTLLALTILGVKQVDRFDRASAFDDAIAKSEEATQARQELETTTSADLLGGAANAISSNNNPP